MNKSWREKWTQTKDFSILSEQTLSKACRECGGRGNSLCQEGVLVRREIGNYGSFTEEMMFKRVLKSEYELVR